MVKNLCKFSKNIKSLKLKINKQPPEVMNFKARTTCKFQFTTKKIKQKFASNYNPTKPRNCSYNMCALFLHIIILTCERDIVHIRDMLRIERQSGSSSSRERENTQQAERKMAIKYSPLFMNTLQSSNYFCIFRVLHSVCAMTYLMTIKKA